MAIDRVTGSRCFGDLRVYNEKFSAVSESEWNDNVNMNRSNPLRNFKKEFLESLTIQEKLALHLFVNGGQVYEDGRGNLQLFSSMVQHQFDKQETTIKQLQLLCVVCCVLCCVLCVVLGTSNQSDEKGTTLETTTTPETTTILFRSWIWSTATRHWSSL